MKIYVITLALAAGASALPRPDPGLATSWWALQPLRESAPPPVDPALAPTAIDAYLVGRSGGAMQRLAPEADRRTVLRRATFGLTGLPPTAEEVEAFAADASPEAFGRVIDRLLATPHYGEHWARHWLDVVRYADTAGETADYPVPVAWRYRNYVIDAFNADKPYDEFLSEQIAGDILAQRGPRDRYAERVTATGYLAISRRFGFDSENYHHLTIQDTIDTLGQSVLGLSLGCARCHDHTFDPVTMADYYALYGIFDSTRYAFPGSEQKQKHRALSPLCPPDESRPAWRNYESRLAALARTLERAGQPVPTAVLRSLDAIDGDFELQAPAAGGSNGVLVPPWVYEGPIAVTADAQSPFQNLHARGRVGASVPAGSARYLITQAFYPARRRGEEIVVHVNLDFRVTADAASSNGLHRIWIGDATGMAAVEAVVSATEIRLRTTEGTGRALALAPNQWHNLQVELDLGKRTATGRIGRPNAVQLFDPLPLATQWNGLLNHVGFEPADAAESPRPAIAFDNLGVQDDAPIAPVSETPPALATPAPGGSPSPPLADQIRDLVGMDGDFELQDDSRPPVIPWGPGPQSTVTINESSQSPFANHFPPGRLGVRLPNSAAYNGFGQTLPQSGSADKIPKLFASFDFRCTSVEAGGDGSWRYYLGHGPGNSAAVELFINGSQCYRRSGDARDPVAPLQVGTWYQVQIVLDLQAKSYIGTIASTAGTTEFSGACAAGWDGVIDNTFIDSYGHLPGAKPALDADNFVLSDAPLAAFGAPALVSSDDKASEKRTRLADLRRQQREEEEAATRAREELDRMLVDGPFPMAYAMSEGSPRDARLHLRGEPSKAGAAIPRGFLSILGGGPLPPDTAGSGRLELAEWLVGPARALTARVMVNRLWQHHFGHGIVRTPNDFGVRGMPPDHPELLDFLAAEFIRGGWSIKSMHRLIMGSAAYRQSSGPDSVEPPTTGETAVASVSTAGTPAEIARTSQPGARFTRRRLSAEETRDAILQVSGSLDPTRGEGHPFPSPLTWGFTQHGPFNAVYDNHRRSIYLMTQRIKRHPFLALFDGPDPNASTPERRMTTVPTQALYFLNDPFFHACSEAFADRLLAAAHPDEAAQVRAAYGLALARPPTPEEQASAIVFLTAYRAELAAAGRDHAPRAALAAFARVLMGGNEFLTVD
ncbi:MAG: DUF1549 and DUF1553 domain-containing protein [Verrucomicrobiales bacterium]